MARGTLSEKPCPECGKNLMKDGPAEWCTDMHCKYVYNREEANPHWFKKQQVKRK
jgi:hypothetical protein